MVEDLSYKLMCFGLPVGGPAEVFCDNKSVVKNLNKHTSILNNKYNAICYHRVREAKDESVLHVGWIPGYFNLTELFIKTTIPVNSKHIYRVSTIEHSITNW